MNIDAYINSIVRDPVLVNDNTLYGLYKLADECEWLNKTLEVMSSLFQVSLPNLDPVAIPLVRRKSVQFVNRIIYWKNVRRFTKCP